MVRATAAPAARPNLAVAAEVRLALPWPRTTSAARRGGQGGGGAGRFRLAGARGDLSPSSLRNRQRLRTQHPRPRAPPRCRRSLAAARAPRPARSPRRARRPLRAGSLGKVPHVAAASLCA
ncbi:serine/arginine repetitive matrix protein 3-like [Leopardus geoffroyi]|uniref:serine/arginine repetitive matrix protein 3-like n=1 Tax=Leopardus geoffroyi TaxID=46844 RepID=UPI001E264023|nr:serine/arginine repetitive matrix protein 3-like [Leopardus geoffroyi]XP_045325945.1 serine/arginine repetitive matrix protein 3-like [Leopardus geoffroyi]